MMPESHSPELHELFNALYKAQEDMKVACKDSENPFFKSKYANLQAVIESSRPSLCKNGLSVIQQMWYENDRDFLITILCHSSGQWISSKSRLNPVKQDPQSLGSYITYIRRYAYAAIVGVYDGCEDDDGNSASRESIHIPSPAGETEYREVQQSLGSDDLVSEKQVKYISFQIGQNKELLKDVLQRYNVHNIQSIKKSDAQHALAYIEAKKQKQ